MTRAPAPADLVNHPPHYQGVAECPHCGGTIEAISITERFGFCLGNTLKYILRAGKKGDRLTDLEKARWYLDRQIAAEKARRAAASPATAPQAASPAHDTRQPTPGVYGAWARNSYTDLHDTLIGPADDAQDGAGLFPSGWTPEADDPDTNEKG